MLGAFGRGADCGSESRDALAKAEAGCKGWAVEESGERELPRSSLMALVLVMGVSATLV